MFKNIIFYIYCLQYVNNEFFSFPKFPINYNYIILISLLGPDTKIDVKARFCVNGGNRGVAGLSSFADRRPPPYDMLLLYKLQTLQWGG